jgi:hypothetical protein
MARVFPYAAFADRGRECCRKQMEVSDDLYKRAASKDKRFHVVEVANHMSLYDVPKYVDDAVTVNLVLKESIVEESAVV